MSLRNIIRRYGTGDYAVTRTTTNTYVDGRLVAGTATVLTLELSIQELQGSDLKTPAEAEHADEMRTVWSIDELKTRSATHEADTIAINGETWEVTAVNHFTILDDFYKATIVRRPTAS